MLHFPSTLGAGSSALPRRTDSLNATQHKSASHEIFLTIEEELHDARRVQMHGQEEDLRAALNMVIERVSQLSNLLGEAYKAQAELEVQLNVAKSNLQLVISNNEMLEEALKRDTHTREVGWRRGGSRTTGGRGPEEPIRSASADYSSSGGAPPLRDADAPASSPVTMTMTTPTTTAAPSESRFFTKFRFTSGPHPSAATAASSRPSSRPGTPQPQDGTRSAGAGVNGAAGGGGAAHHLNSPSLPSLPTQQSQQFQQKIEELNASLERERAANAKVTQEKAALEAELESLSQALFEEANKMVATERIRRAETEEELKEANLEKEALKSALRLLEDQSVQNSPAVPYTAPPTTGASAMGMSALERDRTVGMSHSRSSSREAIKSLPSGSPPPLSPTFLPESSSISFVASSSAAAELQAEPGPGEEAVNLSNPSNQGVDDHTRPAESSTSSSSLPPTGLEPVRDKHGHDGGGEEVEDSEPTSQFRRSRPSSLHLSYPIDERSASPWADVVVRAHAQSSVADPAGSFPTGQTV